MASPNGTPAADEQRDHFYERAREDAKAGTGEAAGWSSGGVDQVYPGEWDFNLELPECPDRIPASYAIDATLVMGQAHKQTGRLRASTLKRVRVRSAEDLEKLRASVGLKGPSEGELQRMREGWDPFAYGADGYGGRGGPTAQFLPLWPGPVTRQLYWADYFAMSAKAFEAYNHDPVSWRCVHMKQEFALGKGLQARITYSSGSKQGQGHEKATAAWEEFWKRCKMDQRIDMMARDLSWGGEQFLRYFTKGRITTVRSLDPASIYDLITDPEDHETVFAYHQQFQTPYELYPPRAAIPPTGVPAPAETTTPGASTRYVIRQILPQEVDHYRINQSAYERRGRSDLFPALGWIKRLRDYLVSHVIRADMLSRICWDLMVKGNIGAVTNARQQLFPNGQPPRPGTVFGHNEAMTLQALVPQSAGGQGRWDPTLDALVTMVANSIGLPKDWLGFGMGSTRASALVATEPAARSLEDLQGTCETILHDCFDRVMATAKIADAEVEFTFPSIATEDRSSKLKDLAFSESNGWVSKQTAASIAAKELGISGYDYEQEQSLIAEEFEQSRETETSDEVDPVTGEKVEKPMQGDGVVRRPMISAQYRQAPKLDPTKAVSAEDEPPGLLVPTNGAAPPTNGAVPAENGAGPPTRAGMPADENPLGAEGAKNIRQDNLREGVPMDPDFLGRVVASAMRAREAERRRRPDDPSFQRAAEEYRRATRESLAELAAASTTKKT